MPEEHKLNPRNYTFKIFKFKFKFKIFNYIFHETYRGHGDDGPPVSVEHGLEGGLLVLLLEHVDQRGEHDRAHAWEKGTLTKFARNKNFSRNLHFYILQTFFLPLSLILPN